MMMKFAVNVLYHIFHKQPLEIQKRQRKQGDAKDQCICELS